MFKWIKIVVINKHRERRKLIRKILLYCIGKLIILLDKTKRFVRFNQLEFHFMFATFELTYDPPPSY